RIACAKRPVSAADIDRLVGEVEARLQSLGKQEIPARVVGDLVINGLKELDHIAYIRYAIVYLGLDDLQAIRNEIDQLLEA
ncbi:MAG: ATP cone domain-containing protein, partial [Anaerolineales bacterium]